MASELLPQEIIRRKRDGLELSPEEISFLVRGITDGSAGEEPSSAYTAFSRRTISKRRATVLPLSAGVNSRNRTLLP